MHAVLNLHLTGGWKLLGQAQLTENAPQLITYLGPRQDTDGAWCEAITTWQLLAIGRAVYQHSKLQAGRLILRRHGIMGKTFQPSC